MFDYNEMCSMSFLNFILEKYLTENGMLLPCKLNYSTHDHIYTCSFLRNIE